MEPDSLLWDRLANELRSRITQFPGVAGLSILDLSNGVEVGLNSNYAFPAASTIKIHVLACLLERAERGEVDLDKRDVVTSAQHVSGSGVLASLDGEVTLERRDIASLMIVASDNTAANLCINWATPAAVNAFLDRLGLSHTRLNRRMGEYAGEVLEAENLTTPQDLTRFLSMLHNADGISAAVCEETLRILRKRKHGYMTATIPEIVRVANKPGASKFVRNDAGIVYLSRHPYIISIMSKNCIASPADQEGFIAEISRLTYDYLTMLDQCGPWGQGFM